MSTDHDHEYCTDYQERWECAECGINVAQYGTIAPATATILHPDYATRAEEWGETATDSQEYGALLVAHILSGDQDGYSKTVADAGLDTHAEVAAISDYIALAHPNLPWACRLIGAPLDGELDEDPDPTFIAATTWLALWVDADAQNWDTLFPTDQQLKASERLRALTARDGIHVILAEVQHAAALICDRRTLYGWIDRFCLELDVA